MVMVMGIFLFSNDRKAVCCVIYFFCWFYYHKVKWISVCGIFTHNYGNCEMVDDSNDTPMVPYHTSMLLSHVVYPTHGV